MARKVKESSANPELERLKDKAAGWRRWGPYVSERSWGTVREDYSANGDAWSWFPHDLARSKAYRWGEDGLAGICDRYQLLVFSLGLWNEHDPIIKERLFGLVPSEGNHGEDVKEYYYYLDSTPTHSYMKYLYKYPQAAYPYAQLIDENRKRAGSGPEYELLDTGVLNEDRYFDVFVEYAKIAADDIAIRIEVFNRGPEAAPLWLLPQLTCRNTWGWEQEPGPMPSIHLGPEERNAGWASVVADDRGQALIKGLPFEYKLGKRYLYAEAQHGLDAAATQFWFTDNETHAERVFGPQVPSRSPFVKDAFHRHLVHKENCINPARMGTKCAVARRMLIAAGGSEVFYLRLCDKEQSKPLAQIEKMVQERRQEADAYYESIFPPSANADERMIERQALAGMLWTKQIYLFDVEKWLQGDNPQNPPPQSRRQGRNRHWQHLNSMRIMSMPDKWEYPWFAAWDLAFHCVPLAIVDPEFAKEQLWLLLFEQFQHPNGQVPAYEWEFSDLNPPVQAWAVWRVYNMERLRHGHADREFLEKCVHKLLINFAWWINKVDSQGNNVFEGGFLGLDNITVLDRSEKLPGGAVLEQSDATGWMGMFCLTLMRMCLELAKENRVYESLATKFFQHYIYVGAAMKNMGGKDYALWDETDGFFYDVLRYPDGNFNKFRVRSLVGIIPIYAVERLESEWLEPFAEFRANLHWFLENRQDLVQRCCYTVQRGDQQTHILTIMDETQLRRVLQVVLDEDEFLSSFGIRSLSKHHEKHPFRYGASEVHYEPGESDCKIKGGNSNWRGPIWFPTSFLLIESLRKLSKAFGSTFSLEVKGKSYNLAQVSQEIANRLIRLYTKDADGHRPAMGPGQGVLRKFQEDPHFKDYLLFYEYFHGDLGWGLGASHQTGWSGLIASLIDEWRRE